MEQIKIKAEVLNKFQIEVKRRYPKKAFGYFISDKPSGDPMDYIVFQDDIRNDMKDDFEKYGNYYKRNEDAGFLTTPEEMYKIHKMLKEKNMYVVGVFHSHQRHPAIFSSVDVDLHPSINLWHLIISLRNFDYPEIKVFSLKSGKIREILILKEV